ncbi:chemosensory receptor a [Plakobranchus ocellatus]|uniref:Chemosensory receptor a n=1 Tax=Plakobranchus ocellatus TaxID=259542 RepID=A0AAV4BU45_9GAST|nr:chemosensory receptor a [Plakobranchus ocellatus]
MDTDNVIVNLTSSPSSRPYAEVFTWTYNVLCPGWPLIILFGLLANLTNIVVFLKAGLKDNVTILLLCLSVSDMIFLILIAPSACTYVIRYFYRDWPWPFDIGFVDKLLYWPAMSCYDFSSYISVWLGVTRCACVAMPLQFKFVFTKARTVKAIMVLFLLVVPLRAPAMSTFKIARGIDPRTNQSSLYLARQNSVAINRFNDILNRTLLPWISFVIMIACVCIIKLKLYQASLVRRSHSSTSQTMKAVNDVGERSSRDDRVIHSVVLICCIFIASLLPFLVYSSVRLIYPEFDTTGRLQYLFFAFGGISRTCAYLNPSVNIFVYYKYNSKYRAILLSIRKSKPILNSQLRNSSEM